MAVQEVFTDAEKSYIRGRLSGVEKAIKENLKTIPGAIAPVPIAGACYQGIWLEHNQDSLFIADNFPESAWAAQDLFMRRQRPDGLLPALVRVSGETFYRQIQSVWPFARCAFEIAWKTGRGEEDFRRIYQAGVAYDNWLGKNRDHRNLGLVEMFCEFDTGHDKSPRAAGLHPRNAASEPHPGVKDPDAGYMPENYPAVPVIAPDLSAMRYQGRKALSELAALLGEENGALKWRELAESTKAAIKKHLYDEEDDYYYDLGADGKFRKFRTEHLTRLYLNEAVDKKEMRRQYARYFENPDEFGTPFPIPSISVSDPAFVKELPSNCWGGNTQALTALRAMMWLKRYGMDSERKALLSRWMRAFVQWDSPLPQELNPFTGEPIGAQGNYMPTLLLFKMGAELALKK